jgi:hypothetical protein
MTLTTIFPHMQTRNWKDWERESWLEHEAMNGILDANNLFFVSHKLRHALFSFQESSVKLCI